MNKNNRDTYTAKPISCCISPSTECLLRCKMCYLWKAEPEAKKISADEWKYFIDSLDEILEDRRELILSGGEPLLNEDIPDFIKQGSDKGFRTVLSTNAVLINEEKARQLIDCDLKEIYISLDSLNENTHDYLRGIKGTHKKTIDAIGYLNKYKHDLKINIITVISRYNLLDIPELVKKICADNKIGGIYFQAISQPFCTPTDEYWYKKDEYRFLWPEDLESVRSLIEELIDLKKRDYRIINQIQHLEKFKLYFEDPNTYVTKAKCYMGDYTMNVNPAGDIFLCCYMLPIGNIRKNKISELWFSDLAEQRRNQMRECRRNCHNMVNCFFMESKEG
jgi:MoaA/NifB/PqqE/SkfB family radical SAM enzyme